MNRPISAVIAEPNNNPNKLRPSPPSQIITIKATPTPGKVAWAIASETSARFRKKRNVPAEPEAIPKNIAPKVTRATL